MRIIRHAGLGAGASTLALTLALLVAATGARADGMFVAPTMPPITEPEQLGFVEWDESAGTETLTLLPTFRGEAREFAWVVPVPAVPELAPAPRALFTDLVNLTAPRYRHRDDGWDCDGYTVDAAAPDQVEVIRHELIGTYDVLVLGAAEAAALGDTLAAWGYLHAGNSAAVLPLLTDYVQRGWVFVAVKVDSAAFAAAYPGQDGIVSGGLDPLALRFAVQEPVYPMRLSSVSAAWQTKVWVWVRAGHRMTMPGATPTYANSFSAAEREALMDAYPTAWARLPDGCFLTRLELTLAPDEMTADLPLARAPTDGEFREIR